jgi:N-acetylglucosamine kinase-like BadF-type ATPase
MAKKHTPTRLIADSGATKTDWCLIQQGKKTFKSTQGYHPFFMDEAGLQTLLQKELKIDPRKTKVDEIYFYGTGLASAESKKQLQKTLKAFFGAKKVVVESDLLGAAIATCGNDKGIVCILGTGSNTGLYTGKKIGFKTPALGYVLGDEGGGSYIGKKVLQYYMHGIFDEELHTAFEAMFPYTQHDMLQAVYREGFPNRYLAQFARFVFEHRGHYMMENIAEDALNDLFINHLLRYPNIHKTTVHFCGSVAWHLKDVLQGLCEQYDIKVGKIMQKPIKGLAGYYAD